MDGISWEQFSKDVNGIFERSKEIGDTWDIVRTVNHINFDFYAGGHPKLVFTGILNISVE